MLEKLFQLKEHHTSHKKEFIAGLTTFLSMAYIIFVNPDILSLAGMDKGALITVTILASVLGTLLVGFWGNVPFAMAPGMGLNAFFTFTLVLDQKIPWQTALGIVFLSGILFLVLTIIGVREKIVQAIPGPLRFAVGCGIGLFITFIGLKGMGLVQASPATLITMGKFSGATGLNYPLVISLLGLVIIACLEARKVPGAILIGVLSTTFIALGVDQFVDLEKALVSIPESLVSMPPSVAPIFGQLDIAGACSMAFFSAIFSFMFVDLFDSLGTVITCAHQAKLVDEDGTIHKIDKVLEADAVATLAGAVMGTSTTTTYIESGSGIAAGGRTGLTAVYVAFFFALALVATPVIGMVPGFATAPALVVVGVHMFRQITRVDFKHFEDALPAFLTIILMPLTYSISNGLIFGFLSYIIMKVVGGKFKEIDPILWVIGALSVVQLIITSH